MDDGGLDSRSEPSAHVVPTSASRERRACAARETVARVLQHREQLGITRVANVTGLDVVGIPVVMVTRPLSRSVSVSQGKGLDLESARASGLMEALELHHAEHAELALRIGSRRQLSRRCRMADVHGLPLAASTQYEDDRALLWATGVNMMSNEPLLVPYELVHMNYTLPLPTGSGSFVMSSNGLASGNTQHEAIVHGLCEVIERDAVTLWHLRTPEDHASSQLDLRTVYDPACRELLALFEKADLEVTVWDVTSDIGVATFRCVIADRDLSSPRFVPASEGQGTHLLREVALQRALTEAAQVRLTMIAGVRDDNGRMAYEKARQIHEYTISPRRADATRDFALTPSHLCQSTEQDLLRLLERLDHVGLRQAISVDLTDPEVQVPVVRVIVPYLETYHYVPGYLPGRRAKDVLARRKGVVQ